MHNAVEPLAAAVIIYLTHPAVQAAISLMADWLYAKIGEIGDVVEGASPIVTVELATPANAFHSKISRIRAFWALNPMLIHKSCHALRLACEAAFAVTGHLPLTEEEKCDSLIRQKLEEKLKEIAAKQPPR
jgi:hypothetical protein